MSDRQTFAIGDTIRQPHIDAVDDMTARIAGLERECFGLAANICIVDGGLLGDDHGHPYCTLQREVERLRARVVALEAELQMHRLAQAATEFSGYPHHVKTQTFANRSKL